MTEWQPNRNQQAALDAAAEPGFRRSITAICEEVGVTRAAFYKWLRDPNFVAAWEAVWYGAVRRHLPSVAMAMVEAARGGDVAAARLVADMAGVIKQKHEHTGKGGGILEFTIAIATTDDDRDHTPE